MKVHTQPHKFEEPNVRQTKCMHFGNSAFERKRNWIKFAKLIHIEFSRRENINRSTQLVCAMWGDKRGDGRNENIINRDSIRKWTTELLYINKFKHFDTPVKTQCIKANKTHTHTHPICAENEGIDERRKTQHYRAYSIWFNNNWKKARFLRALRSG